MRVAALYDIHGNLHALEAVLRDVRRARADLIVVGGDLVPGPMPAETLSCLLGPDVQFRHTLYDLTAAAERVRHTAYPMAEDFAATNILQPPPEEAVLEAFTRVQLT